MSPTTFGAADPPKLRISVGFLFMPLMEAFGDDNVLFLFLGRASAAAADCEGNSKRPESFNVFVEVPRAVGSVLPDGSRRFLRIVPLLDSGSFDG